MQENLVLEKFGDYWGEKAYLDQVTFKIYEDANALMSALSAESVDMAFHLTIDQVNTVSGGAYKTLEGTMNLVQALYLNNDVEPFDNEMCIRDRYRKRKSKRKNRWRRFQKMKFLLIFRRAGSGAI